MRPHPYAGVSGVTTPEQARALLAAWPADAPEQSLMIGVLTSEKVLRGGERNPRSPTSEDVHKIWPSDPRAVNLIHYFTKEPMTCSGLIRALWCAGERCAGIQINVPWPDVDQLVRFKQWAPRPTRVVLQVGPTTMKSLASDPKRIVDRLAAYEGVVTDVLVDASAGSGLMIAPGFARELVEAIRSEIPSLGIGVAGGLYAVTLPQIADLVRDHGLSIDAEGRLRNDRDEFDLDKARAYLAAAAPLLCGDG